MTRACKRFRLFWVWVGSAGALNIIKRELGAWRRNRWRGFDGWLFRVPYVWPGSGTPRAGISVILARASTWWVVTGRVGASCALGDRSGGFAAMRDRSIPLDPIATLDRIRRSR